MVALAEILVEFLGFGRIEFEEEACLVGSVLPSLFVLVSNDTFYLGDRDLVWDLVEAIDVINAAREAILAYSSALSFP